MLKSNVIVECVGGLLVKRRSQSRSVLVNDQLESVVTNRPEEEAWRKVGKGKEAWREGGKETKAWRDTKKTWRGKDIERYWPRTVWRDARKDMEKSGYSRSGATPGRSSALSELSSWYLLFRGFYTYFLYLPFYIHYYTFFLNNFFVVLLKKKTFSSLQTHTLAAEATGSIQSSLFRLLENRPNRSQFLCLKQEQLPCQQFLGRSGFPGEVRIIARR